MACTPMEQIRDDRRTRAKVIELARAELKLLRARFPDVHLDVYITSMKKKHNQWRVNVKVFVKVISAHPRPTKEFMFLHSESADGFPSDVLFTKLLLLAG